MEEQSQPISDSTNKPVYVGLGLTARPTSNPLVATGSATGNSCQSPELPIEESNISAKSFPNYGGDDAVELACRSPFGGDRPSQCDHERESLNAVDYSRQQSKSSAGEESVNAKELDPLLPTTSPPPAPPSAPPPAPPSAPPLAPPSAPPPAQSSPSPSQVDERNGCQRKKYIVIVLVAAIIVFIAIGGTTGGVTTLFSPDIHGSVTNATVLLGTTTLLGQINGQMIAVLVNTCVPEGKEIDVLRGPCNGTATVSSKLTQTSNNRNNFVSKGGKQFINYNTGDIPIYLLNGSVLLYNITIFSFHHGSYCVANLSLTELITESTTNHCVFIKTRGMSTSTRLSIKQNGLYTVTLIANADLAFNYTISGTAVSYDVTKFTKLAELTHKQGSHQILILSENTCIYANAIKTRYQSVVRQYVTYSTKSVVTPATCFGIAGLALVVLICFAIVSLLIICKKRV